MQFLDQPLNHIGARRTARPRRSEANPFIAARRRPNWAAIGSIVFCLALWAFVGVLLAWRG